MGDSHSSSPDWRTQLRSRLKGKAAIVGVGNPLRSDDGVGPAIVDDLRNGTNLLLFNCETAPENYISRIAEAEPDTVVLIDSTNFGGEPGVVRLFGKDELAQTDFSTHYMSPKLFMAVLEERIQADCILLAVQPSSVEFGLSLSKEVRNAADEIIGVMRET